MAKREDLQRLSRDELIDEIARQRTKIVEIKRERDLWRAKAERHKVRADAAKRRYQSLIDTPPPHKPRVGPDTPIGPE